MTEDLPKDLVGNDFFLEDMELNNMVELRTELRNYRAVLKILNKNEKQLRNLRESERVSDLPDPVKSQIDTAHKKVNKAINAVGGRFEKEYNKKPFPWLKEVE